MLHTLSLQLQRRYFRRGQDCLVRRTSTRVVAQRNEQAL